MQILNTIRMRNRLQIPCCLCVFRCTCENRRDGIDDDYDDDDGDGDEWVLTLW